jgi:hypothetical protein
MNQATILAIILYPALGGILVWYMFELWDEWRRK